jgi:hypothetical protein
MRGDGMVGSLGGRGQAKWGRVPIDASALGENRWEVGSRSAKFNRTIMPPPRTRGSIVPKIRHLGSIDVESGVTKAGSTI